MPLKFNDIESRKIDLEIKRFIECQIIEPVYTDEEGEYISNIFARPKKDGRVRIILNLKKFNQNMQHIHFKMETLKTAINLMTPNCFFGSVDISDAFYSIPISTEDRKYFRFWHNNTKYQFTALVMGLTTAPRVFTKILKPVFASLRAKGHISTAYIDDSCLQGDSYETCLANITDTVKLMDGLGLTIHPTKSCFVPSQTIEFVGFILCSKTMTVRLTQTKVDDIITMCLQIIGQQNITITLFSQLIGKLVASEPGVDYAPLYYKPLEKQKETNLKHKRGKYNAFMKVTDRIKSDITWWIDNLANSCKHLAYGNPSLVIHADASLQGYGACIKAENLKTNGVWSSEEQKLHINVLELKACKLALLAFCCHKHDIHVRIYTDNTTCCAYINKYGGKSSELDELAREIWLWCIDRHIHLSAAHIAGVENVEADKLSRKFNEDLEWTLNKSAFSKVNDIFGPLQVDMFASRLNKQLDKYVSRLPEPFAWQIDAFSLNWNFDLLYMFPPFSLVTRVLQKIVQDRAEVVLVAPIWTTQNWWPQLLHLMSHQSFYLPSTQKVLYLPHKPTYRHPLKKMRLGVFRLSGKLWANKEFQDSLPNSSSIPGEFPPENNTQPISRNGFSFVINGKLIQLNPLLVE